MDAKAVLKASARRASKTPAFAGAVGMLERTARPARGLLPVLTYHQVEEPAHAPELYPGLIGATPAEFEEHMRFLASSYEPLSLSELLAVRRGEAPLPPNAVVVTFDDAYRSVGEHAWPIMRNHGVPLTLFVPTAYPGEPARSFWWDRLWSALGREGTTVSTPVGDLPLGTGRERLGTYRRLRGYVKSLPHEEGMAVVEEICSRSGTEAPVSSVLGWDELRRLAGEGVALASHSRTHPLLHRLAPADANQEILGSVADLEREVGPTPRVFAYPGGGIGDGLTTFLEQQGFELAFMTKRGVNDLSRPDWLRLRRINVGRSYGLTGVRFQLLPQWARIQAAKQRVHGFLTETGLAA